MYKFILNRLNQFKDVLKMVVKCKEYEITNFTFVKWKTTFWRVKEFHKLVLL